MQETVSVTIRPEISKELDRQLSRLGLDKDAYLQRCLEISVKALCQYTPDFN